MSFLEKNEFCTYNLFPKHTSIITKLKQKLFTILIKAPSKEAWISLDRESNLKRRVIDRSLIKREAQVL